MAGLSTSHRAYGKRMFIHTFGGTVRTRSSRPSDVFRLFGEQYDETYAYVKWRDDENVRETRDVWTDIGARLTGDRVGNAFDVQTSGVARQEARGDE